MHYAYYPENLAACIAWSVPRQDIADAHLLRAALSGMKDRTLRATRLVNMGFGKEFLQCATSDQIQGACFAAGVNQLGPFARIRHMSRTLRR